MHCLSRRCVPFLLSLQYAELYASGLEQPPIELDVTGMSVEDVGSAIDKLVEAAWSKPRLSEAKTLW